MKYFGGKLPTGKKETGKLGQVIYTIVQNLVALQHVCGYKYATDIQEYTEDTIGMSKVGYLLVFVIFGDLEVYDSLDIYDSC